MLLMSEPRSMVGPSMLRSNVVNVPHLGGMKQFHYQKVVDTSGRERDALVSWGDDEKLNTFGTLYVYFDLYVFVSELYVLVLTESHLHNAPVFYKTATGGTVVIGVESWDKEQERVVVRVDELGDLSQHEREQILVEDGELCVGKRVSRGIGGEAGNRIKDILEMYLGLGMPGACDMDTYRTNVANGVVCVNFYSGDTRPWRNQAEEGQINYGVLKTDDGDRVPVLLNYQKGITHRFARGVKGVWYLIVLITRPVYGTDSYVLVELTEDFVKDNPFVLTRERTVG